MGNWMRKMVTFRKQFILMAGSEALHEWYPENKTARLLCKFAGKEKLFDSQIKVLKDIGFDIYTITDVQNERK